MADNDFAPEAEAPAPETPAPETPAPETPTAETPAPEAPAPEAPASEAPAPETPAPEAPAAETPPAAEPPPAEPPPTPPSGGFVPMDKQDGIFAEAKRILKGRKELRADMKAKGVYTRKDFNIIADSLDLALWKIHPALMWLHQLWLTSFAGMGLKSLVVAGAALLVGGFLLSTITEEKGSFTINISADMLRAGFILSDSSSFQHVSSRLFSQRLEEVNNITLEDIAPDVDEVDGPHNGRHYIAYTFYIKNDGEKTSSYAWYYKMTADMMGASKAVWVMLFEDGRQVVYARPNEDGTPETLEGFSNTLPFSDVAYDYDGQYYEVMTEDSSRPYYGIVTTPFAADGIVAQGLVENVEPGEVHKYTVVIWVEGHDPDCTNDLLGGYAKFRMEFEHITKSDDKASIFDGVYRTEYEDYGLWDGKESGESDTASPDPETGGTPPPDTNPGD